MGRMLVALGILAILAGTAVARPTPTQKCAAAKITAAGRSVLANAKCRAKALAAGADVNPVCLATAGQKLAAAFVKAEATGACPVVEDAGTVAAAVDGCVSSFSGAIGGDAKCAAAKTTAVGKDAFARAKCLRKAFLIGAPNPDPECTAKTASRLA